MAKKVTAQVKLQIPAGQGHSGASGGHGAGPAGRQHHGVLQGVQRQDVGQGPGRLIIPVVITIYADRSFTFITKTPPVPVLIKRAVNLAKGSAEPNKQKVGKITEQQVEEIAKIKMPDLNCFSLESAMRVGEGHGPQHGSGCYLSGRGRIKSSS